MNGKEEKKSELKLTKKHYFFCRHIKLIDALLAPGLSEAIGGHYSSNSNRKINLTSSKQEEDSYWCLRGSRVIRRKEKSIRLACRRQNKKQQIFDKSTEIGHAEQKAFADEGSLAA